MIELTDPADLVLLDPAGLVIGDPTPDIPAGAPRILGSRLHVGSLTFDAPGGLRDFSCAYASVRLVPSYSTSGSDTTTWCGRVIRADERVDWTLAGRSLADFADPDGFARFAYTYNGTAVPFVFTPNTVARPWVGTVTVRAIPIGGDVNKRLGVDWEWPLVGAPSLQVMVS